jgi:hypothetical protein
MTLTNELAVELRKAMIHEAFIYAGSVDPANDLIPVPRYLVETSAEMLEILQQQVRTLRALTIDLSAVLDEFVEASPFDHPNLERLRQALAKIETMPVIT